MKKWKVFCFCFLAFVCFCMLTSCRTRIEYVTEPVDLTDLVEPVLAQRPDNSNIKIYLDVQTLDDVIYNSAAYQEAWVEWETYAYALERTLVFIQESLK